MRYLAWFSGIAVTLVVAIYIVAFTSTGNALVKPFIEDKIKEETTLDAKLTTFSLNMSEFEFLLDLKNNNTLVVKGNYSLLTKAFSVAYRVQFDNLESLRGVVSLPIQGKFYTDGKVTGDISYFEVDGSSDLGDSETTYHVKMSDMNPISIITNVKGAKLSSLLYLVSQNQYARADINLDVNFKNIKPGELDGDIVLQTDGGVIDSSLMSKDFGIAVPNTSFGMYLNAKLEGNDINYRYDLSSNLFKVLSSGNIKAKPFSTDTIYSVNFEELALLKPITGTELRGAFNLIGSVKGSKEKLTVDGRSDVCESDTKYQLVLKEFTPSSLEADVHNLKIDRLLYMLNQPHYTDGVLSINADISDIKSGSLKGEIETTIKSGLLDSDYLTKAYKFDATMPRTTFSAKATTALNGNVLDTKVDLDSNIAKLGMKKARFNIEDSSFKSDYSVSIEDLDKLFFISGQHMRGSLAANGDIVKSDDLDLTMHTNIAGGKIDAKVHNDDLHVDMKSVETKDILYMLIYPDIFNSNLDAKLDYNLAEKRGVFNGEIRDGNFVNNKTFDLVKKYTKIDMYRESFNGDIKAKIDKEDVLAMIDIRSKQASIKTVDAELNTKSKKIDADITIKAKKNVIAANLKGDIDSPTLTIDLEKLMKSKAGEEVQKAINKLFKKLF